MDRTGERSAEEDNVNWEAPELEAVGKKRKINQTRGGDGVVAGSPWGKESGAVGGSVLMTGEGEPWGAGFFWRWFWE